MAKITDPDSLSVYVHATSAAGATTEEMVILTGPKTVQLRVAGNLDDTAPGKTSGVTGRAGYSFMKEEYLNGTDAATLRRFRFPWKMIFEGSFIWVNGWAPADQQTRDLMRDAGFLEQVSSNENACMISLSQTDDDASDLAYYVQASGFTATTTDFDKTGQMNENVDITGATTYFKAFLREQGKLYAEYNLLSEYDIAAITYQAYSFPLLNGNDAKVTASDVTVSTTTPYTNMKVNYLKGTTFDTAAATTYVADEVLQDGAGRWFFVVTGGTVDASGAADYTANGGTAVLESYNGEELIGSTYYAFNRVVTAATGTDEEAHEFNMWSLRQTGDINANDTTSVNQRGFGTVNGEVAYLLDAYTGDTMIMEPGVVIRGFDANSTNVIQHQPIVVDSGGVDTDGIPVAPGATPVSFPFVAAGNLNFASNIVDELDAETYYTAYHTYITTTTGSYTLTLSAGATGDLTWAGTDLDHIIATDYIDLSAFVTNAGNNGLYLVNTTGANTMNITHQEGTTLVTETASITVLENPFESPGAIIVDDNSATDISGQVTAATIAWDFDYTNNNQGGRTPNTDAPITVVAQALDGAEWVEATHTITAAVGQNIAVNPNDELNYVNA